MAEKINKSLDELIKENKGGRGGGRGGGPNRRRNGAGGGPGGPGGLRRSGGGAQSGLRRRSGPAGGIQKRRSAGGSPNKSVQRAAANGKWEHDLYSRGAGGGANSNFRRNAITGAGTGPAKLVISNLDFGVSDNDIQSLFQEFGKIRKAAVHYDRSGRSLGTADVLFDRKADAIKAMTHYNGVSLDGRPMNIQLTTSLGVFEGGQRQPTRQQGGGGKPGAPRRGGGGGSGGPRRGGRTNRGPPKSAADLDADLDAHNAKMQTD